MEHGLLRVDRQALIVALLGALIAWLASHNRSTAFNNYVRLADGWIHGHTWIDWPGRWMDAVLYQGNYYTVDSPFPAVLALPFVPLAHLNVNQTWIAIAVCGALLFVAYRLLAKFALSVWARIALIVFLFAGTDTLWCAELGDVWFLAHLCAMLFTFLALDEVFGRKRGGLIALYAFCAFESRAPLLFAIPFYAWMLRWQRRELEALGIGLFGGLLIWTGYNEWQWGTLLDIGHTIYYHQDGWGSKDGSPFSLAFLPYQFYSFFMQAPVLVEAGQRAVFPYFKVDPHGVALTFTSPALLLCLRARSPRGLVVALWITTLLVAAPDFLYYLNGWYQFGMRHALDFMPFLLLLMAIGVRERFPRWGYALIAASVLMGWWGVWYWNVFFRTGS